ncbi:hypothetical protein [Paenibacillus pabuli]|uniref:hypothetical protein n=1 Tax=Paenibacillus pabuli TaxID=1472 RepID=UPI003CF40B57
MNERQNIYVFYKKCPVLREYFFCIFRGRILQKDFEFRMLPANNPWSIFVYSKHQWTDPLYYFGTGSEVGFRKVCTILRCRTTLFTHGLRMKEQFAEQGISAIALFNDDYLGNGLR